MSPHIALFCLCHNHRFVKGDHVDMSATRTVTKQARQVSNGLFCLALFLTKRCLEHLAWLFCLPFLSALFQSMPTCKLGSGSVAILAQAILAQAFVYAQGTLCPVSRKDTRHWHKGHLFLACCSMLQYLGLSVAVFALVLLTKVDFGLRFSIFISWRRGT